MRLDAHQHYWKIERGDYDWITEDNKILFRDYLPDDLESLLKAKELDGTIVVQAAPTVEETEFLLSLSEYTDSIFGVVGWLNLEDPGYKTYFKKWKQHPKFVGIRVMIQDMEDPTRVLEPHYIEALKAFAEEDFPVDLLVTYDQLPVLIRLLEQVPNLRGVVDHLAKPPIFIGLTEPWKDQMAELASYPNIYCKLSGMVTEADSHHWSKEEFIPYVHHILNVFGSDRVLFGSDWPVCLQAASYEEVYTLLNDCLPATVSSDDYEKLFGENARVFYKISAPKYSQSEEKETL